MLNEPLERPEAHLSHHKGTLVHSGLDGEGLVLAPEGRICPPGEGRRWDTLWMWRLNQEQEEAAAVNPEDGREQVNTWRQLESLDHSRDSQSSETSGDLCCPRRLGTLQCLESWGRSTAASCGETTTSGLTRSFSVNVQLKVLC